MWQNAVIDNKLATPNSFTEVHLRDVLAQWAFSTHMTATHPHPWSFTMDAGHVPGDNDDWKKSDLKNKSCVLTVMTESQGSILAVAHKRNGKCKRRKGQQGSLCFKTIETQVRHYHTWVALILICLLYLFFSSSSSSFCDKDMLLLHTGPWTLRALQFICFMFTNLKRYKLSW